MWHVLVVTSSMALDSTLKIEKEKGETYSRDNDVERRANPPPNVEKEDWEWLVRYWGSNEFKKLCKTNKENRGKQEYGHCKGSKSFACVEDEETISSGGVAPSRLRMYEITRQRSDGTPVDSKAGENLEYFREQKSLQDNVSNPEERLTEEQIWTKSMGPDRPGRVRGMGAGVTPSDFNGGINFKSRALERDEEVNKLRKELEESHKEVKTVRKQVQYLFTMFEVMCNEQGRPPPCFPPNDDGDDDGEGGSFGFSVACI